MIRAVPDPPRMGHEDNLRGPWGELHFAQARFRAGHRGRARRGVRDCPSLSDGRVPAPHADATLRERADERPCPCACRARTETTPNAPSTMPIAWQFKTKRSNGSKTSVQAYQDERTRLEAAYQQLASSLGCRRRRGRAAPAQPAATAAPSDEPQPPATARVSQTPRRESTTAPPR